MLLLRPGDVRMDRAVAEYPVYPPTFPAVPTGLDQLSRSGVFGDPRPATAELGGRLMDRLAQEAISLVQAFLAEHQAAGGNSIGTAAQNP